MPSRFLTSAFSRVANFVTGGHLSVRCPRDLEHLPSLKNSYFCCCSERQVICSCDGNHSSKQEVLKTYELAAGTMSETSAIAESSDSILFLPLHCGLSGRCFFPFSAWFRLREGKC